MSQGFEPVGDQPIGLVLRYISELIVVVHHFSVVLLGQIILVFFEVKRKLLELSFEELNLLLSCLFLRLIGQSPQKKLSCLDGLNLFVIQKRVVYEAYVQVSDFLGVGGVPHSFCLLVF